jgi:hypothetical protein
MKTVYVNGTYSTNTIDVNGTYRINTIFMSRVHKYIRMYLSLMSNLRLILSGATQTQEDQNVVCGHAHADTYLLLFVLRFLAGLCRSFF